MKKTYTVAYGPTFWECQIAIDEDFKVPFINQTTNEPEDTRWAIKEMVEFWAWWEERLEKNEGDYTKTFLQMLARKICTLQADDQYPLEAMIKWFSDKEGWFDMDGTWGIEILSFDDFEFQYHEFEVMEDPQ